MAIYLDYNASTPLDVRVLEEMKTVFLEAYGNSDSRTHIFGTHAKELVERSRREISVILGIDKSEVIFTSGATESNNIAILGMAAYGLSSGKRHIITTAIEHSAVLEPMKQLEKRGFLLDIISPDASGRINEDELLSKVRPDTLLVSVMHVNNETGIIQPVAEIGEVLDKLDVYFHIDAAQSFGKLNDEIRSLKYNMLSLSAHKIYGPQGIGVLILKRKKYKRPPLEPLFFGGSQEFGFRPGTLPVPLIVGLSHAAILAEKEAKQREEKSRSIKNQLLQTIDGLEYTINGDPCHCLSNVINVSFPGLDSESVFVALKNEYAISNGSACTSGSYAPSHVLTSMGLSTEIINGALRISWSSSEPDFSALVQYIKSQM